MDEAERGSPPHSAETQLDLLNKAPNPPMLPARNRPGPPAIHSNRYKEALVLYLIGFLTAWQGAGARTDARGQNPAGETDFIPHPLVSAKERGLLGKAFTSS